MPLTLDPKHLALHKMFANRIKTLFILRLFEFDYWIFYNDSLLYMKCKNKNVSFILFLQENNFLVGCGVENVTKKDNSEACVES